MSTKPESSKRSSHVAKVTGGMKRLSSGLQDQPSADYFAGAIITVALALLLINYERPQVAILEVGAVAESDIIAPEGIKVIDTWETSRQRDREAARVLPVFDYTSRTSKEARSKIERLFATGRDAPANTEPKDLIAQIQAATDLIIDEQQLSVLVNHRFDPDLEKLMMDHLETTTMNGVVGSRTQLLRVGVLGFVRRDTRAQSEVTLTDPSVVGDLITTRAALRSDKLIFPSEYTREERRALGDVLSSLLVPNLDYNEGETEARKAAARESVPPTMVSVEKGKPIVVRGETVTPIKAELIKAAARRHPIGKRALEFAGTVIIVMLLLLVLWQYMVRYQHRHIRVRRHFLLQVTVFAVTLGLTRMFFTLAGIIGQWAVQSPFTSQQAYRYLAPLAVGAVLVTLLTDAHAAFVFSAILSLFVGVISGNVYLAAYTLICSVGAIYHLKGCRDRTSLVRAGIWIGLVNAAGALALDLLGANQLDIRVLVFDSFCAFVAGSLATMVAFALLPLYEWVFEITTDIKLLELSNLNLPLLKRLAEQAPGTYHHSIMVGLLAEAAAEAIGADALFTRVACYYHDIGKVVRPTYFVENQSYMENRHDRLSPKMSSIVLANHVKQGIELARLHKLPPRIISIIPQHHGTGLMKFFYYKAREESGGEADQAALEREFRYPGPKPQTKEAAIIMIADSVEAAARTVRDPVPTRLRNMIETIIARIRDDGQFDECNVTLRELKIIVDSFVKVLTAIHHHRIAYPGYDFNRMGMDMMPEGLDTRSLPSSPAEQQASTAARVAK